MPGLEEVEDDNRHEAETTVLGEGGSQGGASSAASWSEICGDGVGCQHKLGVAAAACAGQSSHEDAGNSGREMLWGMARQRTIAASWKGGAGPSGGKI